MGILSLFKKKNSFFSEEEKQQIVDAIRTSERTTSGEIRVFVESKNSFVDPVDRAAQVFFKLRRDHTEHRNAVLLYLAMKHHELALFADEGIYQAIGKEFWDHEVVLITRAFKADRLVEGIVNCIVDIGKLLQEKFPYEPETDKNELPDEIVFGK